MSDKDNKKTLVVQKSKDIVSTKDKSKDLALVDPLKIYLREISKHKLLTPEEEKELTYKLFETGDINVAKKLVLANLRLVVKIAMEYRKAHQNLMDLIQEGNMGLMKAVSKYDPGKGAKLSTYSSLWIRSYILKFILDNFRLIKIGTTADQKKLFYNLMREKDKLLNQGIDPTAKMISEKLDVSEKSVVEMERRLSSDGIELSLDRPAGGDHGGASLYQVLENEDVNVEEDVALRQSLEILETNLEDFLAGLKKRDRDIFRMRLLEEVPLSLQAIANQYGVSRERIRQIEVRLIDKLKVYMSDHLR